MQPIPSQFLSWHQAVGGREVLFEILSALNRATRDGSVLYHAFFPNTQVMHVFMVDKTLLADPPEAEILGMTAEEDHAELSNLFTSMLHAANHQADEFGDELRGPDQVTEAMRDFFHQSFVKRVGSDTLQGVGYRARMGIGMAGPVGWVLHGWSLTTG